MAVAVDANGTFAFANSVTSVDYTSLTVGSGSNRGLVASVGLQHVGGAPTGVNAHWDPSSTNQTVTVLIQQASANTDTDAIMLGLAAPTSGNHTLNIAWTNTCNAYVNATSYTGVDQTGGATSFPHATSATGSSTAPAVTITSATGDITQDVAMTANGIGSLSAPTQTQLALNNAHARGYGASRGTGAATVTHTWTQDTSNQWVTAGVDIAAVVVVTAHVTRAMPLGMELGMDWRSGPI